MRVDELYQRERYADFVREAEAERVRRDALALLHPAPVRSHPTLYHTLLAALGARLIDLGTRWQGTVETAGAAPARPAGDCA